MHKERFYSILSLIVGITVVVLAAAFVVSERQRPETVTALRSRADEIEARYRQRHPTPSSIAQEEALESDTQNAEGPVVLQEDAIASFEIFREMMAGMNDTMKKLNLKRFKELTDGEKEAFTAFLEGNQELILEVRRLAEIGGPFQDLDFTKGAEIELPHLQPIRAGAYLLAANIILSAEKGNHDGITKDAVAIMRLADAVGREPIVISQLVRAAMYQRLYECVAQNLQPEDIPAELLEQIIRHTSSSNGRDALADALAFETSWSLSAEFDGIRRGTSPHSSNFIMQLYGSIGRPLLNREEEIFVGLMERTSDVMRLPYYQAQPLMEQIRIEAENLSYIHLISRPLLNILLPAHVNHPETLARHEALLGLMQIGLAVEHYQEQHNAYPEDLNQIAPLLGGTLPLDPYTGEFFVYKPGGNGFQLYSARGSVVGANKRPRPSFYDAQGNIVWRYAGE